MEWNSTLYDKKHDFVAEYGKGLLEFVPQNTKQSILDLGCGTGALTAELAELCERIVGVDGSQNMINKAREEFGDIEDLNIAFVENMQDLSKLTDITPVRKKFSKIIIGTLVFIFLFYWGLFLLDYIEQETTEIITIDTTTY